MATEVRGAHSSEWAAITKVAQLLGIITPESVRTWVRQATVGRGARVGMGTEDSVELKRLNAETRSAISIVQSAWGFAAELDRPCL